MHIFSDEKEFFYSKQDLQVKFVSLNQNQFSLRSFWSLHADHVRQGFNEIRSLKVKSKLKNTTADEMMLKRHSEIRLKCVPKRLEKIVISQLFVTQSIPSRREIQFFWTNFHHLYCLCQNTSICVLG